MTLLAHSERKARNIPAETYCKHISEVRMRASKNAVEALAFYRGPQPYLQILVDWAGTFHDLGKLEEANQKVLRSEESGKLPLNHVDAGAAHLVSKNLFEPALLVYSHHLGLCCLPTEAGKYSNNPQESEHTSPFRDPDIKAVTDKNLATLVALHQKQIPDPELLPKPAKPFSGMERRLSLSLVVDGDHGDTARHYQEEPEITRVEPQWEKRLESLDRYVSGLGEKGGSRTELRKEIYRVCRETPDAMFWACDSPVGSGKTTAVMAYLLQEAIRLKLRHIFVVLPYTNIVQQSVKVYRKALALEGEDPQTVVAAHHHRTEFGTKELRYLTTLWNTPIIVTTAVQFFETLGANETMSLRKLHQLPGSAVFIDEAHAAMPVHLWPFMWRNLRELAENWTCRFVLGSGSLAKFWENQRILGDDQCHVPSMIPESIRMVSASFEKIRVQYKSRSEVQTLNSLCDWIAEYDCPRLVVMNTVQGAAVVAKELRKRKTHTLHLSTALTPGDREVILKKIEANLGDPSLMNWVLVATSCVEAGVDLSFRMAFRERSRATSIIQIGGRTNRHGEKGGGVVWDFAISDPMVPVHPDFKHSRAIVESFFEKDLWNQDLTILMTKALAEELKRSGQEDKIGTLLQKEKVGAYPEVAKLTKLIQADTRLVVVEKRLQDQIKRGEKVSFLDLSNGSVQLWAKRIDALALPILRPGKEIYEWNYPYDKDFLGVMAGILEQVEINSAGCAIL